MKRKPIIGETLVRWTPKGRNSDERIEDVKVTKVGRKFFSVSSGFGDSEFELDDWGIRRTDNVRANFPKWIFESTDELEAHKRELRDRASFSEWKSKSIWGQEKLPIEKIRAILEILEINPEP